MGDAVFALDGLAGRTGVTFGSADRSGTHRLAAFEELLHRHLRSIHRVAYRLAGNADDAEDLVQEALVEAFRAFDRYQPGTYFDRWVYRIMTRTHIDRVRRRGRRPETSLDAPVGPSGDALVTLIGDTRDDPQQLTEVADLDGPIQAALDRLPEEFKTAVVLADVEGLSYDEIAAAVGCPVGTVRSRLHRGREMLRHALRPHLVRRSRE
ncbi:MAG TPA: sigma-70 family RNA polymerase sigma factor [bacterium]|nr:sigma-70 family RNA polymerase sigma factor [bacterium]